VPPTVIPDSGLLDPSTEYHYRLIASNAGGQTVGPDQTFVTAPDINLLGVGPSLSPADTSAVKVGDQVTCLPGEWTDGGGAFANSFSYTWWRTDNVSDPVQIPDATTSLYTMSTDDAGKSVFCKVTATNAGGSTTYATGTVDLPMPPAVIDPPQVFYATVNVDDVVLGLPGVYDVVDSQSGEWVRCDAQGDNCIGTGMTDGVYLITLADVGSTLRYRETAMNRGGQTVTDSDATPVVPPPGP
jgi:hypothetical protein